MTFCITDMSLPQSDGMNCQIMAYGILILKKKMVLAINLMLLSVKTQAMMSVSNSWFQLVRIVWNLNVNSHLDPTNSLGYQNSLLP